MKARPSFGLTLVELMVVVAVVAVLLTLAAPSMYDFILVQRLKAINAQLVTDIQFARSTAASGNLEVQVVFVPAVSGSTMSCYTLYTDTGADPRHKCDCTKAAGERCAEATTREIRTVQIPTSSGTRLGMPELQPTGLAFLATTGAIRVWAAEAYIVPPSGFLVESSIDPQRSLHTWIGTSGRPTVCAAGGGLASHPAC
jgi:type IV fimbrial biogenesis protein FimT